MHQVLHIQEILLNVFGYCCPDVSYWTADRRRSTVDLATLARTCRTFKEPALDVLWSELVDLTPLPRCIPEACRSYGRRYAFRRAPIEEEWYILRSHTRRIWHIYGHANPDGWLDTESFIAICCLPVAEPLFPNLRTFYWQGLTMIPAVHIAVPSLTSLNLNTPLGDVWVLREFFNTIEVSCPNIKQLEIHVARPPLMDETICRHVRSQTSLREFICHGVVMDADTISHLSRIPALTHLYYSLTPNVTDWTFSSSSVFTFSTLTYLEVKFWSLQPIMRFLSCVRLPVAQHLEIKFFVCPSKEDFRSYTTALQNVCSTNSLASIKISGIRIPRILGFTSVVPGDDRLTLDDVRPCMAFVNFRHVHVNIQWSVDLTDSDMLSLVSTWPHLQTLLINVEWGWRVNGGITVQGLLQLLRMCPSLSNLCVAIHTESYTDLPHGFETQFLPLPSPLRINFADSPLRFADIPALMEVVVKLGLSADSVLAWDGANMDDIPNAVDYKHAWYQLFGRLMERGRNW